MKEILTREKLRKLLRKWQKRALTSKDLHGWAESKYMIVDYDDWESGDEDSVSNTVLAALDQLNMNLTTREDAQAYLKFLDTPKGEFEPGLRTLNAYLDGIDIGKRRDELKSVEPYVPFCR